VTISEADAILRARDSATERGWEWREPVHVSRQRAYVFFGRLSYEVRSNADSRGCNVRVVVDAEDGSVKEAFWLPR
jgi:hypothetical protein